MPPSPEGRNPENRLKQRGPRVIFYDIETAPSLGYYYDLWKEGNIVSTVQSWFMLSFAYKVQGEAKIHYHCLADYPGYDRDKKNDKALVTDLHRLVFSTAQCLIGHNIDCFDSKKSKARFVVHGLPPPPPVPTVDTLKIARSVFKFDSNRLNSLGEALGLGGKTVTTGWKMFEAAINGDLTAWAQLGRYNRRDVDLLERVHERLAPYQRNAPFLGRPGCPSCFSERIQQRGYNVNRTGKRPRFQCQDCGHWHSATKNEQTKKAG
jgi:hypothetical protein